MPISLRDSGVCEIGWRYRARAIHEFGHVLHELQLNAWVLAYRRHVDEAFLSWEGETLIEPERKTPDSQHDAISRGGMEAGKRAKPSRSCCSGSW